MKRRLKRFGTGDGNLVNGRKSTCQSRIHSRPQRDRSRRRESVRISNDLYGGVMEPIDDYFLIKPKDLGWRPSNLMKIPNTDFLERTGSEIR